MWKEYNRRNKNIRKRWRSRYKSHNKGRGKKFRVLALMISIVVLLVFLVIYAGSCIRDLSLQEDESAANMNALSSVEIKPTPSPTPTPEPVVEKDPCVVLDAGHGGMDGGTFNGDIIEKDINLSIVQYIKEILEENEMDVVLTRTRDELMELQDRVAVANDKEADMFVSIHCNYFEDDAKVSGLESYSYPGKEEGAVLSETIIDKLRKLDEIKVRSAKEAEYYVLNHTDMPAVLVEVGFLSNHAESQKLNSADYQKLLAQGIADAILQNMEELKEAEKKAQEEAEAATNTAAPTGTTGTKAEAAAGAGTAN